MATKHDLVVIGAGPGGYIAAIRAAQLGLDTACVDDNDRLGGTCLRIGCIPSKALLESSARYAEASAGLDEHGIELGKVTLDLEALLKRKDKVVDILTRGVAGLFKKNKIERYQGRGRLAGDGRVLVETEGKNGDTELEAEHIIIATGSDPAPLEGVALDGDRIGTSTEALSYPKVPRHLVVIGAGYIGLEMGSVWSRLGASVTVLEYLDRILPGLDAEIAGSALKLLSAQGLEIHLGTKVTAAKRKGGGCVVEADGMEPISCDRVLLAVGRRPHTEGLGLEEAGVETDDRGFVRTREAFATSARGIYAIGDVIGGAMLAHKAEDEGVACVEGIVNGTGHVDYGVIPAVVYTEPEIAAVGKTEEALNEEGIPFRKGTFPFRASARARAMGHTDGLVKVLAHQETDRILGVHILGRDAGELIAEAAAAMAFGASAEDLFRTCHAHPTLAEALKEAALATADRTLNL
jgi:dihydrolipoamide dehydrogenase